MKRNSKPVTFAKSEILIKALFLNSKYTNLLKEITAQKKLFKTPLDYWTTFYRIAMYQNNVQRIILNYSGK